MIVLALDTSKHRSGASVLAPDGTPHIYGVATKQTVREAFVRGAVTLANEYGCAIVVVAEEWDKPRHRRKRNAQGAEVVQFDQKWTFKTVLGMGEGWGLWMAELERYDLRAILRVTPNNWRDNLFGKRRGKDRESAKRQAIAFAEQNFSLKLNEDDDAAEALCLGKWAFLNPSAPEIATQELHRRLRAMKRLEKVSG